MALGDNGQQVALEITANAGALQTAVNAASDALKSMTASLKETQTAATANGGATAEMGDALKLLAQILTPLMGDLQEFRAAAAAMATGSEEVAGATQTENEALRVKITALQETRTAMSLYNDMEELWNATAAESALAWLKQADGADNYALRLQYLREQLQLTQAQQNEMASNSQAAWLSGVLGNASSMFGMFGGGASGFLGGMMGMMGAGEGTISFFSALGGAIDGAISPLTGFVAQAMQLTTALIGWQVINQAISWVSQLSDEMFHLQVTTQRVAMGWEYMFGGDKAKTVGVQQSRQLMQWMSKFSLSIPFTKQDAMQGGTMLASLGGANEQQIQALMPALADLASTYGSATHGGQGTTLAQAAQAVAMAKNGMSRMLKYDLGINPEELIPYGLQGTQSTTGFHISDPNSLYRALIKFAEAKVPGAAQDIATSTWWGGWSSIQDNVQNFLTQVGGTNMDGTIRQGSFFDVLNKGMSSALDWFKSHQDELTTLADTISTLLGDAVSAGGGMLGQFVQWLGKIHIADSIKADVKWLDDELNKIFNPNKAQQIEAANKTPKGHRQELADQYSQTGIGGDALVTFFQAAQAFWQSVGPNVAAFFDGLNSQLPTIAQSMQQTADGMQQFTASSNPQSMTATTAFWSALGSLLGWVVVLLGNAVLDAEQFGTQFNQGLGAWGSMFDALGTSIHNLQQQMSGWKMPGWLQFLLVGSPVSNLIMSFQLLGPLAQLVWARLSSMDWGKALNPLGDVVSMISLGFWGLEQNVLAVISGIQQLGDWISKLPQHLPSWFPGSGTGNTGGGGRRAFAGGALSGFGAGAGSHTSIGNQIGAVINVTIQGNGDAALGQMTRRAVEQALASQGITSRTPGLAMRNFGMLG